MVLFLHFWYKLIRRWGRQSVFVGLINFLPPTYLTVHEDFEAWNMYITFADTTLQKFEISSFCCRKIEKINALGKTSQGLFDHILLYKYLTSIFSHMNWILQ